jgi:hypothetical protein
MRRIHPERVVGYFKLGPPNRISKLCPLLPVDASEEPDERPAVEASSGPLDPAMPVEPLDEAAVGTSDALTPPPLVESSTDGLIDQLTAERHRTLPKYVQRRKVAAGTAYYWCKPSWAREAGCPIPNRPLGRNLERARAIASSLNDRFDAWRTARSKRPGSP